ncbi:hypothetical protein DW228_22970 [Bacteroides fragilis]|uniref:Uncharacterized protein n=1 Tax=Bacteroides fragilis TaxID=817 RepID=A0A396BKK9_BACFG|nr:hypothetical protein [Bacteroides fragilis]RHH05426.1 hypothetical protein DW228_22970 [Bacteroides fragilis]
MTENIYSKYETLLDELETNFDDDPMKTMCQMVDLYENLNSTYFHDLYDSISLWITENGNEKILKYIEDKHNPELKKLQDFLLHKLQNRGY